MKKAAVWFLIGLYGVPFITERVAAWRNRALN